MTPEDAAAVNEALRERTDKQLDLCLWGDPHLAADYKEAGVTWLLQAAMPDTTPHLVRDLIAAGPPT